MTLIDRQKITLERLRELISYDPDTGFFRWHCAKGKRKSRGGNAGYYNSRDVTILLDGRFYNAHRIAWLYHYGRWPKGVIDHINHNPHDNRIANLRETTVSGNAKNKCIPANNKSGQMGVSWHKARGKWQVTIKSSGRQYHGGLFDDLKDAIDARKALESAYRYHQYHGMSHSEIAHVESSDDAN